ncbi:phosphatase PAP2 family protein [Flavobacterium sp. ZT3R18]|uniref:phosphatase PAP2 family protein n=1 Tax=Flavobacterium sp. ZT3R18 TaxID=2594429 RepID=UPI00117B87FF|nr:phosphatase PAP2 family protein [Flavobacterium sp. ZT3R18]TRX35712.1 phosphatase PAP2 family protein [Flavobacterium sp. ZT3R18]
MLQKSIKKTKTIFFFLIIPLILFGHENNINDSIKKSNSNLKYSPKQLIIPAALITYSIIAIESDYLKYINSEIKDEINESIDEKFTVDDFSQYAPALAVYGLNNIGIKGKNDLKDRTIILGTSFLIMSGLVLSLKSITKIERPDGSSNNSFPSGHTATAFAGAEFLWQEYKDVSIWYGISGYVVATGTGFFRIYNDRHWFTDVVMGAGIGILSTKIAYWIFPSVESKIFKSKKNSTMVTPFYNGKQMGLGLILNLK